MEYDFTRKECMRNIQDDFETFSGLLLKIILTSIVISHCFNKLKYLHIFKYKINELFFLNLQSGWDPHSMKGRSKFFSPVPK